MLQNIIEVLILSAIQGISEFLPISSSAHLILVSSLYEFKSSSLLIDISLHLGSLFAIVYFFKTDLLDIKNNKRLLSLIIIGSIPLIVVGYVLYSTGIIYELRNIKIIAWTTLIFGIVLYIADRSNFNKKISSNLNLQSIMFISLFQILSLVPGVSRAGITITAARILKCPAKIFVCISAFVLFVSLRKSSETAIKPLPKPASNHLYPLQTIASNDDAEKLKTLVPIYCVASPMISNSGYLFFNSDIKSKSIIKPLVYCTMLKAKTSIELFSRALAIADSIFSCILTENRLKSRSSIADNRE